MSEKALRWIINIAGVVCLYAFLAVRILPLFNAVLLEKYIPEYWENTKWGELYYFNFIKHFRERNLPEYNIKYRFTDKHPSAEEADLLTFGDSFFDFSRMTTFPEKLGDSLEQKVFYSRNDRPLQYLAEIGYTGDQKKYILVETAERFFHDRFETQQESGFKKDTRSTPRKKAAEIRDFIFPEDTELLYAQLLNRSYFTTGLYSLISTLKFDLFGYITVTTPRYFLGSDRPWLFGGIQVNDTPRSFYYQHTQEEIENYCNNIASLASELKSKYNLEMVFMIIPSKYSIYHTLLNNDHYNNFIPRVNRGLKARGIPAINIYDEYIAQRDSLLLYYGTDTHWTEEGLDIAMDKTMILLDSLSSSDYVVAVNEPLSATINN